VSKCPLHSSAQRMLCQVWHRDVLEVCGMCCMCCDSHNTGGGAAVCYTACILLLLALAAEWHLLG